VPRWRRGGAGAAALLLLCAAAVVPLCGAMDAWVDRACEAWRTCRGVVLAEQVSDLVRPVGIAVLVVAVARALWRGRPGWLSVLRVLAALGTGALLIGALKDFLDRPRPGAEFLVSWGGSFPSGHVANTVLNGITILTLWSGVTPPRARWRGSLVLAVAVAIVALARVYGRRHWASDTVGAVAVAGAYGVLAMLHPDIRWRTATTAIGLLLAGLAHVAASAGLKVPFPAGSAASRQAPVERIAFGSAYEQGRLRGDWALDAPDPERHSAWLRSGSGEVSLPDPPRDADEVRIVARPRRAPTRTTCERLRIELNGHVLGEPLLQAGWRAYVFPSGRDFRSDANVLALRVLPEGSAHARDGARAAAFSELTLHAAGPSPGR